MSLEAKNPESKSGVRSPKIGNLLGITLAAAFLAVPSLVFIIRNEVNIRFSVTDFLRIAFSNLHPVQVDTWFIDPVLSAVVAVICASISLVAGIVGFLKPSAARKASYAAIVCGIGGALILIILFYTEFVAELDFFHEEWPFDAFFGPMSAFVALGIAASMIVMSRLGKAPRVSA
jgi:hypothetical protein